MRHWTPEQRERQRATMLEHYQTAESAGRRGTVTHDGCAAPSPEALAEAVRAYSLGHQSIIAAVAGDPLPGRSALDKLRRN